MAESDLSTDPTVTRPLTAAEEQDLARRWAAGERAAYEHLYQQNQPLVASIARRYQGQGVDLADLLQEGGIGLLTAIGRFDATRGLKLSTSATPWIHQRLQLAIANQGRMIRLPVKVFQIARRVARARTQILSTTGSLPSVMDVAQVANLVPQQVRSIDALPPDPISLDMPLNDTTTTMRGDLIPDRTDPIAANVTLLTNEQIVRHLLHGASLLRRERQVLQLRYGIDGVLSHETFAATAVQLGLTTERIRQIEARALRKLRMYAASHRHLFAERDWEQEDT